MQNIKENYKTGRTLVYLGAGIIGLFIILLALNYFQIISLQDLLYPRPSTLEHIAKRTNTNPSSIIAKAGRENIYQKDLDTEIASFPLQGKEDIRKQLIEKLVKDSIILQAAQGERWIKLDASVFNSLQKDYAKRVQLVNSIRNIYENKQNRIAGSVISIWFYNMKPGSVGYEKGKEIALRKITGLHNRVKSKEITMFEAAQEIINDKSLAQVDVSYESNAIYAFDASPNELIGFDPEFDKLIRRLAPGEVTDIFLAKSKNNKGTELMEKVYMFAQVSEIKSNGSNQDFDHWYAQKEKKYEIIYY